MFYVRNDHLNFVFLRNWKVDNDPMGFYEANFDKDNGSLNDKLIFIGPIPPTLGDVHTVDNILYWLLGDEFILTTVGSQLAFLKYKIE